MMPRPVVASHRGHAVAVNVPAGVHGALAALAGALRVEIGELLEEHPLGEFLSREGGELLVKVEHEDILDSGVRKQLEPTLERREKLDSAAEHGARVRIEGHDARAQPGRAAAARSDSG